MKTKSAAIVLDPGRVAAWRLGRQLLTAPFATTPEAVARRLLGVQAQVVSSAAMAVALRGDGLTVESLPTGLAERRLVRAWAFRGTLHAFDADDYPTIVGSLRRRETWRRPVWFRYFEVTEAEMESIIEGVGEVLDDGRPRTRRELAADLGTRLGKGLERQLASSWGTLLKPAADRGYLIHATGEGNTVTFTRPSRWIGRWRDVDPEEALPIVLRRYLASYGPASIAEVQRWWGGLRSAFVKTALAGLGDEVARVEVAGAAALLLAADVDATATMPPLQGAVTFIGPFDPLIVGAGSRAALIPSAHYGRVSRTAGWISPVVLVDGVAAGIWSGSTRSGRYEIRLEWFAKRRHPSQRVVGAAAERLATAMGMPVGVTFGPVSFGAPPVVEEDGPEG